MQNLSPPKLLTWRLLSSRNLKSLRRPDASACSWNRSDSDIARWGPNGHRIHRDRLVDDPQ